MAAIDSVIELLKLVAVRFNCCLLPTPHLSGFSEGLQSGNHQPRLQDRLAGAQ